MEQKKLLNLLSQQDNRAYHYLYRHYYIALKTVANYYVRNDETAEDLVQEVFISMLEGRHNFATLNDIKYFLYATLKNKCLNHLRGQKVRDKYYHAVLASESEIDQYWEQVLKEDVYAALYNAIQTLSPQLQQVMLLSLDGMKLSEIAQQLKISLDTVKEYKAIGKWKLLALLKNRELRFIIMWF